MSKAHLITFCNDDMSISANICMRSALRNNVSSVTCFKPGNIDDKFKEKNKSILSKERGAGYWLWKPYFINDRISKALDGDILIYSDAGVEFINNINWITDRMKDDVFLFGNMYDHVHWCKQDVIKAICPANKTGKQVQASVIFIRVSDKSKAFVKKWLDYCQRPGFIDDSKSVSANHPEFREHRHDQAILTCLAYKDGLPLHWWPAIYNAGMFTYDHAGYTDNYPAIFHHHRFRNNDFNDSTGINGMIKPYFKRKGYKISE